MAGGPSIDGYALDPGLALFRLRRGHGQHTITELGLDPVLVDIAKSQAPLEVPVDALAEGPATVFSFRALFAAQDQNAVLEQHLDVLFLQARQFGGYLVFAVGVPDLDLRPAAAA